MKHLKLSDEGIALQNLPLKNLRKMLRNSGVRGPADLLDIHRQKMIHDLKLVCFRKYNPEFESTIAKIAELRKDFMDDVV